MVFMISVVKKYALLVLAFGAFGSVFSVSREALDLGAMRSNVASWSTEVDLLYKDTFARIVFIQELGKKGQDISSVNMKAFEYLGRKVSLLRNAVNTVRSVLNDSRLEKELKEMRSLYDSVESEVFFIRALNANFNKQLDEQRSLAVSRASCQGCGKASKDLKDGETFSICSKCRNVFYCSEVCQRKDWRKHKPVCVSIE